jgi:hypothetical protein
MAFVLIDTKIEMQSALAAPINITGISKAAEAVITCANSFSPGDIVVIDGVGGMVQINGYAVRVKSATGSTFTAEGLNSTNFSTWVSGGTASKVTAFLAFDNASGFNMPDPPLSKEDATPISALERVELAGLQDAFSAEIPLFASPMSAHMVEARKARSEGTTRAFKITTRPGNVAIINAEVSGGAGMDGTAGSVATGNLSLTLKRAPQWFAS